MRAQGRRRALSAGLVFCALALPSASARIASADARTTEALAVWQQRSASGDWDVWFGVLGRPPGRPATELAWWTPSGDAGAPVVALAGDDENPAIAVRQGTATAIAVWQHADGAGERDVWWSRFDGAAWSPAAPLATLAGDDVDPAIAIDAAGSALAVWVSRSGTTAGLVGARYNGTSWSGAAALPGTVRMAALPEVAFLDSGAGEALAAYADLVDDPSAGTVARTHIARYDGSAWSPGAPLPLSSDQAALMPAHASVDYAATPGAFPRIGIAPLAGGAAQVWWGGPVGEPLAQRYSSRTVMASRLDPGTGAWTPLRTPSGSAALAGGCNSPAVTATGRGDTIAVYGSTNSLFEHARLVGGDLTVADRTFDSVWDDVRPALAPLGDRVVLLGSGLAYPWDPSPSVILWSLGTLRQPGKDAPANVTWTPPAEMSLPGAARYPAVASLLGGTQSPLAIAKGGRAFGAATGDKAANDTGEVSSTGDGTTRAATDASAPPVFATGLEATITRTGDVSVAVATASEVRLATTPPVVVRDLRATASAGCTIGPGGSTTIGWIQVGDAPRTPVDARTNTSVPLGVLTLKINEQTQTLSSMTVRALHLVGSGVDVTVGYASALVTGCPGSGLPVPGGGPHEH